MEKEAVSFEPLKRGGANFITERLNCTDPERWVFKKTLHFRVSYAILLLIGAGMLTMSVLATEIFLLLFFLIFGGFWLGISVQYFRKNVSATFDFSLGAYWRDRRKPRYGDAESLHDYLPLKEIAALQILEELCRGSKGVAWHSFELNLVTKEGRRFNITDHGGRKALEEDAAKLAERLNVPVWKQDSSEKIKNKKDGAVAGVIIASFFILSGAVMFCFLALPPLQLCFEAKNWQEVPATVVSSRLETSHGSKGKTTYRIAVSYHYHYQGRRYSGKRYDLCRSRIYSSVGVAGMRDAVRRHPAGARVMCYVNPDAPGEALIERELPASFAFYLVIPLLFCGLGIFFIVIGLRRRK